MNSSAMPWRSSRVCGRLRFRACWTLAQTSALRVTGVASPWLRPRSRSTMGSLATLVVADVVPNEGPGQGRQERARLGYKGGRRVGVAAHGDRKQIRQDRDDLAAHWGSRHDPVHEAVAKPELGAGVAARQLLAHRAGRTAGGRATEERVRLRQ